MIKMVSKRTKNQKGFTLVELIVVIAILGILGAIAVPKFGGFRESAAVKADDATMDVIRNAVMVALASGDIEGDGTITITTESGTPIYSTTTENTVETITSIMNNLLGADINAQVTNKTGFTVIISSTGDVGVYYIGDEPA